MTCVAGPAGLALGPVAAYAPIMDSCPGIPMISTMARGVVTQFDRADADSGFDD